MNPVPHETPSTGPAAALSAQFAALVPVIMTQRTSLRAPVLADLPPWYAILCSDRSVYMDGPYTRDEAFTEFAASTGSWLLRGYGLMTVEDRHTSATIGFVALNMEPSDQEPELGYFCVPGGEGLGLMSEAAAALRGWAKAQQFPSLVSYVDPLNPRSAALAARIGAVRDPVAEAAYDGTADAGMQVWRHFPKAAS